MAFVQSLSTNVFVLVFGLVLLNCFSVDKLGSHAQVTQLLPEDEVQILKTVSSKLHNNNWTIDRTSCGSAQWNRTLLGIDKIQSNVTCDCTFVSGTVCHVISFKLKGFNLTGVLPSEFRNLTHLREIDLTRNYLNGSIPASLAELPNLQTLSLIANRLTGSIPREFGSIATLESLTLEDNLLGGSLHPDLGNLRSLKRLLLSANNFTGTIPDTFGNLKNLTDFRIDGSELSGKIPSFIGNWTNIERLDFQGTSMEGPMPPNISLLKKLEELRISDLNGSGSTFPDLQDMNNLTVLILRNCSMTGTIPGSIGDMASLNTLDLSFNKFTGQINGSLESLAKLRFMFLNNNLLTGEVPGWILNSKNKLDLSYNNFTGSTQLGCQQLSVNLVSSHVTTGNNSISWCLNKDLVCSRKPEYHSLFINCGGNSMTVDGNEYEDDTTSGGAAEFVSLSERWGYSSTGTYMNNDKANYKAENSFGLKVTGEGIYQTARLAPQSLKYYALCMRAGSYRVKLHFAEIMYSNDSTFSSLGRRIFDISIQGNVVKKDFNIMEEAGGVGRGIAKEFDSISVSGSTLEIDLYWSGKGTTAVPDRGVYGPLISAITVTPNFKVDTSEGLSVGAIIGIVAASCVLAALVVLALWRKGYLGGKDHEDKDLRALDLQTGYFSLRQIKNATNNFDPANKIGEGGFGCFVRRLCNCCQAAIIQIETRKSRVCERDRHDICLAASSSRAAVWLLY
uniref:non-specific serine/threonine protein kinase n=1 Tax=Salix viminalis TaxID=40686 RepID=A0A6N2KIP0_SALVM